MKEIDDLLKILPHKHPYLQLDRVLELDPGNRVVAVKAVSYCEELFRGHFPDQPVLPGAIIIEAASQAAGLLNSNLKDGKLGYVLEVKSFKFRKKVKPGYLMIIEVLKKEQRGQFLLAEVAIKVDEETVASGELQLYIEK